MTDSSATETRRHRAVYPNTARKPPQNPAYVAQDHTQVNQEGAYVKMTNQPIETDTAGLATTRQGIGLSAIKADSPRRFKVELRINAKNETQVWSKLTGIETDADGFALMGTLLHNTWNIKEGADAGKQTEGYFLVNELGQTYTRAPQQTRKECIYQSGRNEYNRACTLGVDPAESAKVQTAAKIADLTKTAQDARAEAQNAQLRAEATESRSRVLVAIMLNDPTQCTAQDVTTSSADIESMKLTGAQKTAYARIKKESV